MVPVLCIVPHDIFSVQWDVGALWRALPGAIALLGQ